MGDLEFFFEHFGVSERDRNIYRDFFVADNKPKKTELARKYNISPTRIHQIIRKFERRRDWWTEEEPEEEPSEPVMSLFRSLDECYLDAFFTRIDMGELILVPIGGDDGE
jgi:hypothetical protein